MRMDHCRADHQRCGLISAVAVRLGFYTTAQSAPQSGCTTYRDISLKRMQLNYTCYTRAAVVLQIGTTKNNHYSLTPLGYLLYLEKVIKGIRDLHSAALCTVQYTALGFTMPFLPSPYQSRDVSSASMRPNTQCHPAMPRPVGWGECSAIIHHPWMVDAELIHPTKMRNQIKWLVG